MSAIMPTYGRLPVTFASGAGAHLTDQKGRQYLDALSGIAVTNLGHSHPNVTRAVIEQAESLLHTSNLYGIARQERLAAELNQLTGMERIFFCNSGAEANETAIKMARRHGHNKGIANPQIVVLEGAFHGRTMGALSATGSAAIQAAFKPLLPGFIRIARNDIEALETLAKTQDDIVAIHLEHVQGERGFTLWTTRFWHAPVNSAIRKTGRLASTRYSPVTVDAELSMSFNGSGSSRTY